MSKPTEGPYTYHPADKRIVGPTRDHKLSRRPVGDGRRYPEMMTRDVIAYLACPTPEKQDANGRLLAKSWEMHEIICDFLMGLPNTEAKARALLREIDGQ